MRYKNSAYHYEVDIRVLECKPYIWGRCRRILGRCRQAQVAVHRKYDARPT